MIRFFHIFIPIRILVLFVSECILTAASYLLAAALLLEAFSPEIFLFYEGGALNLGVLTAAILLSMYALDLYTSVRRRSRVQLVLKLMQVIGIAFVVEGLFSYIDPQSELPQGVMFLGSAFVLLALTGSRLIYDSVFFRQFGTARVLFVGADAQAVEIAAKISGHPDLGFTLVGLVSDDLRPGDLWQGIKVLGGLAALGEIASAAKPDRVALFFSEWRQTVPLKTLLDLHLSGVRVEDGSMLYEAVCGRICVERLRPSDLIFHDTVGPRPSSVALQSIYTNLAALCVFAVLVPFLPLAALLIKLSSPGPVFERETRLGFRGVPFTAFRFRCTTLEGGRRKQTVVGRWFRRFHLEGLPRLWNIVRGEMALIGPRPERPEFVRVLGDVIPYFAQKQCVKPGLTGWSQINSVPGEAMDTVRTLEYDLYYIKNISLALDAYIMLQAFKLPWSRP